MERRVRVSSPFRTGALALLATLASAPLAEAAPHRWVSRGPFDKSTAYALAVQPGSSATLYAAADTGVAKSTDAGFSWSWSSPEGSVACCNGPYNVRALAIDPSDPNVVYAGTIGTGTGAFKSTDAGATWVKSTTNMNSASVLALAIDPVNPLVVYAGLSARGIYKSTDAGASWAETISGMGQRTVAALAIDPTTPSTLYAGTSASGVYKSTNAGANWAPVNSGLSNQDVSSLAIDASNPATLYAGALAGSGAQVSKSTNGGATWAPSESGLPDVDVHGLALDPGVPGTLYAAMFGGVFKSTDAGSVWSHADAGIESEIVLAVACPSSGTVYAGSDAIGLLGGVHTSLDGAQTWVHYQLPTVTVTSIAVDPVQASIVYAGTSMPGSGLHKSTDAGVSWTSASTGLPNSPSALAVDPQNTATVYAAVGNWGVYKSTDAGGHWDTTNLPIPPGLPSASAVVVDPLNPSIVYAGVYRAGVFRSTDAGGSWTSASSGLSSLGVFSLAIDPQTPTTLYGSLGGLYKTTNSGGTWSAVSSAPQTTLAPAIDPVTPTTLYLGTYQAGMSKSTDGGVTWGPINMGLPATGSAQEVALDPSAPSTVYAGIDAGLYVPFAVYRTTNGGASWGLAAPGFPDREIFALAVSPSGRPVYSGGRNTSVWQLGAPSKKGDLNGDGVPDLLFRSATNLAHNKAWFMDGVTRSAEADITPDASSPSWRVRGVDDFDADGRSDLAFWNEVTGHVEFWLMNGVSRIGAPLPLGGPLLPPDWDLSATADFNHDTRPDIVWRSQFSGQIVIWTMNGTGAFGNIVPSPDHAVNANWAIVAAADYNDDGNTDFLWYNATSGKIVTWYMDASVVRTTGQFTTPDAAGNNNWKVVASADYSRAYVPGTPPASSPDLVWRNETSGNQVVWHLDFASTRVHGQFTNPSANSPALDWTIVGPR